MASIAMSFIYAPERQAGDVISGCQAERLPRPNQTLIPPRSSHLAVAPVCSSLKSPRPAVLTEPFRVHHGENRTKTVQGLKPQGA